MTTQTTTAKTDRKGRHIIAGLADLEAARQDLIARHGLDVRTMDESDRWAGHPIEVRRVLNHELNRRRFVAAGLLPADC